MADTFLFAQLQPYSLSGAGASIGDTSITLKSMLDIDGNTLSMSGTFGSIGFGTLEPGNGANEEQISFTGLTNNSNGTVTLSGVKSVGFTAPYTATSGLAKTHPGSTTFVISNTAGFYDHLTSKNDDETIAGIYTFTNPNVPRLDTAHAYAGGEEEYFATKRYVDGVAIAGAPDASTTVKGITKMSVAPASATSPISVGDNDPRVPTQAENDALVGTSGTPSSTNKFVTNADTSTTAVAGAVVRFDSNGVAGFDNYVFGNGADGDVTISVNTSLSRDMYYSNLTVNTGVTLNPNGYRIFVSGTTTISGTGLIARNNTNAAGNGTDGGNATSVGSGGGGGGGGAGGTGGIVALFSKNIILATSTSIQALGGNGGNGGNGSTGASGSPGTAGTGGSGASGLSDGTIKGSLAGNNGSNGGVGVSGGLSGNAGTIGTQSSTLSNSIGSASANCSANKGGNGGTDTSVGGTGGTGNTSASISNPAIMPYVVLNSVNLYSVTAGSTTPVFSVSSQAANGGGGGGAGGSTSGNGRGGGGGGGQGGNGGTGGVIVLVYKTINMALSSSAVAGGAGGTGGSFGTGAGGGQNGTNGDSGVTGASGVIYNLAI